MNAAGSVPVVVQEFVMTLTLERLYMFDCVSNPPLVLKSPVAGLSTSANTVSIAVVLEEPPNAWNTFAPGARAPSMLTSRVFSPSAPASSHDAEYPFEPAGYA